MQYVYVAGCSDTGLRGPEHYIFAVFLNMAAYVGNNSVYFYFPNSSPEILVILLF